MDDDSIENSTRNPSTTEEEKEKNHSIAQAVVIVDFSTVILCKIMRR